MSFRLYKAIFYGAERGTRTRMRLLSADFESAASANFAISANSYYRFMKHLQPVV